MSTQAPKPPHTPVPPEFLGMARAFRSTIAAVNMPAQDAMRAVARPLRDRLCRKPKIRPEAALDAVRLWRTTVPEVGRLHLDAKATGSSLAIRELRLSQVHETRQNWSPGARDPGLLIVVFWLEVTAEHLVSDYTFLASVSQHALARRFQRGFDNRPDAILADLRAIAGQVDAAVAGAGAFVMPVGSGLWSGELVQIDERGCSVRLPSVRTFVPALRWD